MPCSLSLRRESFAALERLFAILSSILQIHQYGGTVNGGVPHTAKAIDVVPETDIRVAGTLVIAIAGATVLGAESPRATANHFVSAFNRSAGILPRRLLVIVHLIEVVAPLPYVAGHVIKSPRIRFFLTD